MVETLLATSTAFTSYELFAPWLIRI